MKNRDWQSERPKKKVIRQSGRVTSIGWEKPYNTLIDTLAEVAALLPEDDRGPLRALAWGLGMNGETHACEAIMAKISEKKLIPTPWGYMTEEQWRMCGGQGYNGV